MPQPHCSLSTSLQVSHTTEVLPRGEIPHVLREKSMLASLNFNPFIMGETSHWKTKQLCANAVLSATETPEST